MTTFELVIAGGGLPAAPAIKSYVSPAVAARSPCCRAKFTRDPWSETHLHVDTIDPWTTRLDWRCA